MRFFRTEVWSYAVLLIILFAIAALAVTHIISYLEDQLSTPEHNIVVSLLWMLTLGFMFIAGAYGLWAIQFAGEAESRRRIGRIVDAMDYLSDGLLSVDPRGVITGSNPAARALVNTEISTRKSLREIFPCLTENDVKILLDPSGPNETQAEMVNNNIPRMIRFRSQPSENLSLILLSDVTAVNVQLVRNRQVARLQLIGQIAQGVAHDFNNLLCGIAGYAAILPRLDAQSPEMKKSLEAISRNANRGISLAGHLLDLSRPESAGKPTSQIAQHVKTAVDTLRDSLPQEWQIESSIMEIPSTAVTGLQIEQIIINLGLLAADTMPAPGLLRIALARPSSDHVFNVGERFAGVLVISLMNQTESSTRPAPSEKPSGDPSGVIVSVLQSLLAEAGGKLDRLTAADGSPVYRVALPYGNIAAEDTGADELPCDLAPYFANWSVLLVAPAREYRELDKMLSGLGAKVDREDNIISALTRVEEETPLDGMILDKRLLGREAKGLVRAILKLRPAVGAVILCEEVESDIRELPENVVAVSAKTTPARMLTSLIEAKSLISHRQAQA